MPVYLDRAPSRSPLLKYAKVLGVQSPDNFQDVDSNFLDIGIINNMPDGALEATERQFLRLLDAGADGRSVRVMFYALPEISRSDSARRHIRGFYSSVDDLWNRQLDGLIITGTEPKSANLADEPYWSRLTAVFDWAEDHTYSTICSCLAAHAAVLHLDGIDRVRLPKKRFGLFQCARPSDHPLMAGLGSHVLMPHSRWNDLRETELVEAGYCVLTRSADAGVDAFVRQRKNLFVCFQGHPEYEAHTLLTEYRRDIGRYLRGERDVYPAMPHGLCDPDIVEALTALAREAMRYRREELIADFPAALIQQTDAWPWRTAAASIYTNWLTYLCSRKQPALKRQAGNASEARLILDRSVAAGAD